MSEIQNSNIFEEFEGLAQANAAHERVVQQARDLEIFLNDVANDPSAAELQYLEAGDMASEWIAMMNQECTYIGQPILVSGEVTESYVDPTTGGYGAEDTMYVRQPVWSAGYGHYRDAASDGRVRMRVGHIFNLGQQPPVAHEDISLVQSSATLYGFASIGNVDIESLGERADPDSARLRYEVPGLLNEFNQRIAGVDDECAALHTLSDMTVPSEYDIPTDILLRFEQHAYDHLTFDQVFPYALSVQGLVGIHPTDGHDREATIRNYSNETQLYVVPERLTLRGVPVEAGEGMARITNERRWALVVKSLGYDYTDNADTYTIPVHNIMGMQSLRRELHQPVVSSDSKQSTGEDEFTI